MKSTGEETVWKRLAVLIVISSLPVSVLAHTKLFYRVSYRSDYRKVEVVIATSEPMVTEEPTEIPLVEIPLESTLTPEPTLTLTESPTPTPSVDIIDAEVAVDTTDQITTPSDVDGQVDIATL